MKDFVVTIELDTQEMNVKAKNKTEAKKKALTRLAKKDPTRMIRKAWPSNRKEIDVVER